MSDHLKTSYAALASGYGEIYLEYALEINIQASPAASS